MKMWGLLDTESSPAEVSSPQLAQKQSHKEVSRGDCLVDHPPTPPLCTCDGQFHINLTQARVI